MSQNDLPPSSEVVPAEQMQIDTSSPEAQRMVQMAKMMERVVLPTSSLQTNSQAVFGQLHTTDSTVAPVQLQNGDTADTYVSVFGFRWHYGRNNDHYNTTVRHRNDVAKHSKDSELKFKTEASKDNKEMQMHRDKLVANLETSRQASVDKLTNNVMDHRERMFSKMCDHMVAMKKLDLEQQQESNYHERKLKRLQPKKKHRGGRQGRHRESRRAHSSSQPIVESHSSPQPIVEEMDESESD